MRNDDKKGPSVRQDVEGIDLRRSMHMVPNELDVSPEAMNLVAFAAMAPPP